jgi:predicted secreted Zn-dependent protease
MEGAMKVLIAALWLALVGSAAAEPLVKRDIAYYDVAGATAREIRAELDRLRPTDALTKRRLDATTRWHVKWTYRYRNVGQDCAIARIAVTVDATIMLPRLAADTSRPAELTRQFEEFAAKLLLHEEGHVQNGIDIAKRIEAAVLGMKPHPTCDALGRAANALAQSLIKEANQNDVDYDARTQDGRTQGARFP